MSQGAQELIIAEGKLSIDQNRAMLKEWEVRGYTDTGQRIGSWLMAMDAEQFEAVIRGGGFYYMRDDKGEPIVDPMTGEYKKIRIYGTDELANRQFIREEDRRCGYQRVSTYLDENDEMKVLYDADGKPVLDRVYGTDEIDRLDRERDDEWERDKYTGFWKEDAGYGHPIWIDGAVSISQLERDLKKELVEMGYDHETAERRANQVYQDKVREGYRRWDTNQGKYIEIRGTQSHEEYIMQLQNDLGIDRAEA